MKSVKHVAMNSLLWMALVVVATKAQAKSADSNSALPSNGQNAVHIPERSPIQLIPELGASSFTIRGTDSSSVGYTGGMSLGILGQFDVGVDRLRLASGLEFFTAGAKQDFIWVTNEIQSTYMAVPLKATYFLTEPTSEGVHWNINAGLKPSYLISAKQKVTSVFSDSAEKDIKDQMSHFDLTVGAGVGGDYEVAAGHTLTFGFSYQRGTQKVLKDISNSRNEGYLAQVGYVFSL